MEDVPASDIDTTFRITLPDNSIYSHIGKISVIDRAVDPQTGSIRVRITVPNGEKILKPGMSCKVLVLNDNSGEQVLIPYKAVLEQLGEYFVFVRQLPTPNSKLQTVKQVKVALGPRVGSDVIILKGLDGGETIAVDGIQKLHDGSAVTIAPPRKQQGK
jgi:membrane fusion protein (multidrug efflux system)